MTHGAEPLRVLHVVEALETGVARHVVDLVRHTPGVEHHVLAPPERVGGVTDRLAVPAMRAAGATVTVVPMRRTPTRPENLAALRRARALVRGWRPDVVHGHSTTGGVIARLASIGTPTACVYTPNAVAAGRFAAAVERGLSRLTDRIIAVSPSEAEELVRRGVAPAGIVTVVPNGIALEDPAPQPLRPLLRRREGLLVGTMGRVSAQKATVDFVRVCAALAARRPDVTFVLIGDGPARDEVRAEVARADLGDRFTWLPELEEAASYLHDLDVFVLPSRFEGGPYAPLEAMRAGVPVVLTDVVGSRDVVEPGRSGLLVASGDVAALTGAVTSLLDEPALRSRLTAGARRRLGERFSVGAMGAATRAVYDDVVAHPRRTRLRRRTVG